MAEYVFSDEQAQLRAAVRKFADNNFGEASARVQMESEPRFDRKVWQRLGSELGVLGLSVPEVDGGVGGTLVDQAVAVEELGAALSTGPLFGTVYLAIPALVAASAGAARDELLAALIEGTRTAAFAVPDRAGAFDPSLVTVTGTDTLTGTVARVVDGVRDRQKNRVPTATPTNCWSPQRVPTGCRSTPWTRPPVHLWSRWT